MSTVDVAAPDLGPPEAEETETFWQQALGNVKSGNLGVLPVVVGEILIVTYFAFTATNFFTAANFTNVILQMAGTTLIAFGVVFVLLLGEIDLSIAYVSGICAVAVAEFQLPSSSHPASRRLTATRPSRPASGSARRPTSAQGTWASCRWSSARS